MVVGCPIILRPRDHFQWLQHKKRIRKSCFHHLKSQNDTFLDHANVGRTNKSRILFFFLLFLLYVLCFSCLFVFTKRYERQTSATCQRYKNANSNLLRKRSPPLPCHYIMSLLVQVENARAIAFFFFFFLQFLSKQISSFVFASKFHFNLTRRKLDQKLTKQLLR